MEDFSEYNGEGTELRKAQLRMLDILQEIDKVCKRHDIPYWIDFGTLLGAVRHAGFIPWDDDADVTIFKKDSKLLERYLAEELPEQYYIFGPSTSKRYKNTGYFRIVDRRTQVLKIGQDESHLDDEGNGISVDIFNVEKGRKGFKKCMNQWHGRAYRRKKKIVEDGKLNYIIACLIYPFTSTCIAIYRLFQALKPSCHFIYNIPNFVVPQMFSQRELEQIFPLKRILFEGIELNCPNDSDAFLKETYHDYMTIPPREKRVVHTQAIINKD